MAQRSATAMPFLTFQVGRANSEHVHDVGMPSMLGAYASAHFRDSNETQWCARETVAWARGALR